MTARCACWESCQDEPEPDSDLCWECQTEGCPGGRSGDDSDD